MENPGKGTQPKNPGKILIRLFKRKKLGIFPKRLYSLILIVSLIFCHDITLIIKCD
jgi:hypothetical protein